MPEPRGYAPGPHPPDRVGTGRRPAARGHDPALRRSGPAASGPVRRRQAPRRRAPRRWDSRPGRLGVSVVIGSAALGALVTVLAGTEPGAVLGAFLVAGTVIAALAVQPRTVYLIIPAPALAYVVAAIMAGLIHDRADDASLTALAVHAAQWIASGFLATIAATTLAIAITAARWPGREPPPDRAGSARTRSARSTRW